MGQALPKPGLRPFLPADMPVLAAIFVASIEELTGDDYSEAQQQAWAAAADDEEAFGKRLAGELDADRDAAEFAGRLCLAEGRRSYRHALCPPERGRAGRRVDAVRCAGKARGRPRREEPDRRCQRQRGAASSPSAAMSPSSATPSPSTANGSPTPRCRRRWPIAPRRERRHEPRTPLSVRHHAARRRADQRRRFHAARQADHRADARRTRHRLCRGRLSRRQSDRHRILCQQAEARTRASPRSA